jgi:hypothetical protein
MATAQTGRNDNCPCGSGKKYKKCCLARDEAKARGEAACADAAAPAEADALPALGMSAYSMLRLLENPNPELGRMLRGDPRLVAAMAGRMTIAKAAAFSVPEILARLAHLGIDATPEDFRALAGLTDSAWAIGEAWAGNVHRVLTVNDVDFLSLAACELWKRWCPEPPSVEMLDDWMQDGYTLREQRRHGATVDLWVKVWDELRRRFSPDMTQCADAECVFRGTQYISNWTQDFMDALVDATRSERRYAPLAIRYATEVLAQFTDEDCVYLHVFSTSLARAHFLNGKPEAGETVCRELVAAAPASACGYVTLADALIYDSEGAPDYARAIAVLAEALAIPVQNADDYGVSLRLQRLREESARAGAVP